MKTWGLQSCFLGVLIFLMGCQTTHPMPDTFKAIVTRQKLQRIPGYDYLLLEFNGRQAQMALGYRAKKNGFLVEHWYAGGEMLEMRDGRVYKVFGMTHEIRRNTGKPPSWEALASSTQAISWSRQLDLMPGYRFDMQETVSSRKLSPSEARYLPDGLNDKLVWVRDDVQTLDAQGQPWNYMQLFALLNGRVVYSEQCINEKLCMNFRFLAHTSP
jgi:hypothetical protein